MESLTDLETRNADIQQRRPGSTALFTTVEARIHAAPPVDRPADRARQVKLEHLRLLYKLNLSRTNALSRRAKQIRPERISRDLGVPKNARH